MKRTFDFKCDKCGNVDEDVFVDEKDDDKQRCSKCGHRSRKMPAVGGTKVKGRYTAANGYGLH